MTSPFPLSYAETADTSAPRAQGRRLAQRKAHASTLATRQRRQAKRDAR